MALTPESAPAPRDILPELRAHRGLMMYRPESNDFVKFAVSMGTPTPQGFIPLERQVGVMGLGVIYLKSEGGIQSGYYAVKPRDLNRRRIDARPTNRLSLGDAAAMLGAPVPSGAALSGPAVTSGVVEDPEASDADLAFQQQIDAIQHHTNPEEDFL